MEIIQNIQFHFEFIWDKRTPEFKLNTSKCLKNFKYKKIKPILGFSIKVA